MRKRFVVYTALFGGYDEIIDPPKSFKGCDFICFTDQKDLKSSVWDIRVVEDCDLPPNMMNRRYKFFPNLFLDEYDYSLYIDANIKLKRNPISFIEKYLNDFDVAIPKHFKRKCLYDEARVVVKLGRANELDVSRQVDYYKDQGYPENNGLHENNVILRRHNEKAVIDLMNDWWRQMHLFTQRDQLSLKFVLWLNEFEANDRVPSARGSKYFSVYPHSLPDKVNRLSRFKNYIKYNYPNLSGFLRKVVFFEG